jgi:hypothetical protein
MSRRRFDKNFYYEDDYQADIHVRASTPPPRPETSVLDTLGKPFLLFLIGGLVTFALQWAVIGVRVASLEQYVAEHKQSSVTREDLNGVRSELKDVQKSYITRDEFNAAFTSLQRGVSDLRDEIRDLVRAGRK